MYNCNLLSIGSIVFSSTQSNCSGINLYISFGAIIIPPPPPPPPPPSFKPEHC